MFSSGGKTNFLQRSKMRFSIKVSGSDKMFFHVFPPAERATGLHRQIIQTVLDKDNTFYQRRSDGQLFAIRKEDPILVAKIEGEDFFSLEEIQKKFGVSPTKFLNQVQNGKLMKKIDWISPELSQRKRRKRKMLCLKFRKRLRSFLPELKSWRKFFRSGKIDLGLESPQNLLLGNLERRFFAQTFFFVSRRRLKSFQRDDLIFKVCRGKSLLLIKTSEFLFLI